MSDEQREYTVQKLRGGFAIVWWEWSEEKQEEIRRRRQLTSQDRQSAKAEARKLWATGDDNTPWSVGRLMEGYLASIADKPSYGRRKDAWKALRPFWEQVEPSLVDEEMCKDYARQRAKAESTVRYELIQVSTALKWGRDKDYITAKPEMWLPTVPEGEIKYLSREQFARFFDAVKADHARTYVMIGLHTAARPQAILELTWDRVDFMRRTINFIPPDHKQTKKKRVVVPMSDELLACLQKAYQARTCEYVIERGGEGVKSVKKAFQAASERSTVRATPYTLRHTGAVWAAENGVSMAELAQFMGHDDDRTTQKHYARFSPEHLRNVANAIGKAS